MGRNGPDSVHAMSSNPSTKHEQLIHALNLSTSTEDDSASLENLLTIGAVVGEGIPLQGQVLHRVKLDLPPRSDQSESDPAPTFEVVRKLGTGSYAVVWLVKEIVSHPGDSSQADSPPRSDDDHIFDFDHFSSSSSSSSSSSPSSSTSPTTSNSSTNPTPSTKFGRNFALKCLSKANLDSDALAAQLLEANIHQSLPIHPNIVTLHRTLETPAYLFLLLEYVPGQDLFYFLESARDSLPSSGAIGSDYMQSGSLSKTPTTPSLLSGGLMSHQRLRLIASMFGQMCTAVAVCHQQGVYHRDIKPENFIVTECRHPDPERSNERRVVVKLTDFGLATTETESCDMDCGSAPYMSFECRNNLAPSYRPQPADIWSLGIVLINMLYHHNPWSDTSLQPEFHCPSFQSYRTSPDKGAWFEGRFRGIGAGENDVGGWLARRVFCFLDNEDGERIQPPPERVTAEELGKWVRQLPTLIGRKPLGYNLAPSVSQLSIGRVGRSRRPSLRNVNGVSWIGIGAPRPPSSEVSLRSGAVGAGMGHRRRASVVPPPLGDPDIDNDLERELDGIDLEPDEDASRYGDDGDGDGESQSRAASASRRRKRGARKSKGGASQRDHSLLSERERDDDTDSMMSSNIGGGDRLDDMAVKSQLLARELSKASSWVSVSSGGSAAGSRSRISLPSELERDRSSERRDRRVDKENPPPLPSDAASVVTSGSTTKKKGWKGLWKMTSTEALSSAFLSSHSVPPPLPSLPPNAAGGTAANVSNLVMGLAPQPSNATASTSTFPPGTQNVRLPPHRMPRGPGSTEDGFIRGRKSKQDLFPHVPSTLKSYQSQTPWSPQPFVEPVPPRNSHLHPNPHNRSPLVPAEALRTQSPNWRNSVSTTSTGFTRYSNGSARSLDTVATSASGASASSWRDRNGAAAGQGGSDLSAGKNAKGKEPETPTTPTSASSTTSSHDIPPIISNTPTIRASGSQSTKSSRSTTPTSPTTGVVPLNVKMMTGVPWELTLLPRQLHVRPAGDIFGQPPIPRVNNKHISLKQGRVPPHPPALDTISEQPTSSQSQSWRPGRQSPPNNIKTAGSGGSGLASSPLGQRRDASTSTTDLTDEPPLSPSSLSEDGDGQKKVHKGQINTLAKMLSALRR